MPPIKDHPNKRATDVDKTQEIEALIQEEDDKRMRTLMLVVQNLNTNIRDLTIELRIDHETSVVYRQRLDDHMADHAVRDAVVADHISTAKGAKMMLGLGAKVFAWLFGVVQLATIGVCTFYATKIEDLGQAVHQNEVQHATISEKLRELEKKP